jgi:2-(1,2-epoxy-1,2-dihydrophenyl)acetyl-CoA isomerase
MIATNRLIILNATDLFNKFPINMSSILFAIKEGVATITLNRPDKLNSFNREMALLMQEKLDECATSKEVRCVNITGAGKGFCAGQDLAEVADSGGPGFERILSEHYNPIITKIRELKMPVVAAINGVAAGAGANIALACDIVVSKRSASFIQAFSKIGLIPDSGGTFFLPRLIGWQKASAIMMLGDKVSAEDAERWGMIYKYFEDDVFETEANKLAATLANMPTKALAYIKKALQWSFTNNLEEQLAHEDKLQQRAAATEDYREGLNAFIEKRPAVFKGK